MSAAEEIRTRFRARAAQGRRTRAVEVPDLGTVHVRGMTATEYDRYESACVATEDGKQVYRGNRPLLVRMTVCTPEGSLVFRAEDDEYLATLPPDVVNPLAEAAYELTGLGKKAEEQILGNSPPPPGGDS